MDSCLFLRKWACRRMAANGLGIILFRYADWLLEKGYRRSTIHLYTQAVEHFGFWRAKHHARSQSVQASEVAEFLNSHLSRCDCPPPAATHLQTCRSALNRFMWMLGCRKSSWQSCEGEGPTGTLVADFDQHLREVCGLSPATRFYRRRYDPFCLIIWLHVKSLLTSRRDMSVVMAACCCCARFMRAWASCHCRSENPVKSPV
jgi:hypothetical protein